MKITKGVAVTAIALVLSSALVMPLAIAQAGLEVVAFACDKNDAVAAIKVKASAPGEYTLQWNNQAVCGRGT